MLASIDAPICENEHDIVEIELPVPSERLISWKQIARYLGVTVRTAQRWESWEGLPVRRHRHSERSSVYANPEELDRWWNSRTSVSERPKPAGDNTHAAPSIAVLPFANFDRDEETEILSDGLTEDLITVLSQVPRLRVIARSSVFYFKSKALDVRKLGSRLGVEYLVEGSLRRVGKRLRVTAQLISVADGFHLWAQTFDRELDDPFAVQEQLAHVIARSLRVRFLDEARAERPRDRETYHALFRGRYFWSQRTKVSLERALACFEEVVAREPDFAAGHAGLADCYLFLWLYGSAPRERILPKAEAAASRALELNPMLPDAYRSLSGLRVLAYDFPGAEAAGRRALELNPGDHQARHHHALILACLGRFDEALADMERALELDPFGGFVNQDAGTILYLAGRYDDAILRLRYTLEIAPEVPWARVTLVLALLQAGEHEQALAEASGEPAVSAWVRARSGDPAPARNLLESGAGGGLSFTWRAILCLSLGENRRALELFETAARGFEIEFLALFPRMRPLFIASDMRQEFDSFLTRSR